MKAWVLFVIKSIFVAGLVVGSFCVGHLSANAKCPFLSSFCPIEDCACKPHDHGHNHNHIEGK